MSDLRDPYLILHKVRGEMAFDIAEKLVLGGVEQGWIIPTSGHRAYPIIWFKLEDLVDGSDGEGYRPYDYIAYDEPPKGFDELPDHYRVSKPEYIKGIRVATDPVGLHELLKDLIGD